MGVCKIDYKCNLRNCVFATRNCASLVMFAATRLKQTFYHIFYSCKRTADSELQGVWRQYLLIDWYTFKKEYDKQANSDIGKKYFDLKNEI